MNKYASVEETRAMLRPTTEREKAALELQKELEEAGAFDQGSDPYIFVFDEAVSLRMLISRVSRKDRRAGQMIIDELKQMSEEGV